MWGWFVALCVHWQQGVAHAEVYTHTNMKMCVHPHASVLLTHTFWSVIATPVSNDTLSVYTVTVCKMSLALSDADARSASLAPSVSPAGKTRIDTILRLTERGEKNPRRKKTDSKNECRKVWNADNEKEKSTLRHSELQDLSLSSLESCVQRLWVLHWLEERVRLLK